MKTKFKIIFLLVVTYECKGGLLNGLLSTAQDVHSKIHETAGSVIGGLTHGLNINIEGHVNRNPPWPGHDHGYHHNGEYENKKPTDETVFGVVEEHVGSMNNYGQGSHNGFMQHKPGYDHHGHGHHHYQHHDPSPVRENEISSPNYGGNHPGYSNQQLGFANHRPGHWNNQPGYADSQPGYGNNGPGYGYNHPGYGNDKPGYGHKHPGYDKNEHGYGHIHPGYDNHEHGYGNNQPGYGTNEHGYGHNHPGYDKNEHGCGHNHPGYDNNDHGYGNNQPGYGNNIPSYGNNQHGQGNNQPSVSNNRPAYGSYRPGYGDNQADYNNKMPYDSEQSNAGANHPNSDGNEPNINTQTTNNENINPTYGNQQPNIGNQFSGINKYPSIEHNISYGSRPSYTSNYQPNNGENSQQGDGNDGNDQFDRGNEESNKNEQGYENSVPTSSLSEQNNYDQTTEFVTIKLNYDQTQLGGETTTTNPQDAVPLFISLDPSQSHNTEGNDPKGETDQKYKPKPTDDDEDFKIDMRFKEHK